jgi:hypothetical protein
LPKHARLDAFIDLHNAEMLTGWNGSKSPPSKMYDTLATAPAFNPSGFKAAFATSSISWAEISPAASRPSVAANSSSRPLLMTVRRASGEIVRSAFRVLFPIELVLLV